MGLNVERLIDSRRHVTFNDPAHPEGRWVRNEHYRHSAVGDVIVHDVAAPGVGRITYRVTRTDHEGTHGIVLTSSVRELRPEEVR